MQRTTIVLHLLMAFFMSSCAPHVETVSKRYFWPLPVNNVDPKVEYIAFYQSTEDVLDKSYGWMDEYVLGKFPPVALFSSPYGVGSFSGQRVFVSDTEEHKVLVLDRKANEIRDLKDAEGKSYFFAAPLGVCETADGYVYVADSFRSQVHKFNPKERLVDSFGGESVLKRPVSVAVYDKLVYILDVGAHQVVVFDDQGNLMYTFGGRGNDPGQFNFPTDIDLDQDGNVYVLDALNFRVQVFSPSGDFIREFGEQGTELGSFRIPKGLAVSAQGHVYVTDSLSHRFVVFDLKGQYLLTLGDRSYALNKGEISPGGFYMPRDIAVDSNGGIWVVDGLNKMVHHFQYLTEAYLSKYPISREQIFVPRAQ